MVVEDRLADPWALPALSSPTRGATSLESSALTFRDTSSYTLKRKIPLMTLAPRLKSCLVPVLYSQPSRQMTWKQRGDGPLLPVGVCVCICICEQSRNPQESKARFKHFCVKFRYNNT